MYENQSITVIIQDQSKQIHCTWKKYNTQLSETLIIALKKIIQYKISSHILFLVSSHTQRNTEKSNAIDCSKKTFRPHKPIATMRKTSHVSQQQIFSGNCIFHIPTKSTPLSACSSRYADSHKSPQISSKYMTSHYRTYY